MFTRLNSRLIVLAAVATVFTSLGRLGAHEVDHYTLPQGKQFIDMGDYWDDFLYRAVKGAVDETNFKIRQVQRIPFAPAREALLKHYHSHDTLAWTVRRRLPSALMAIEGLEMKLRWRNLTEAPPGKIFGHRSSLTGSVFSHFPLLPDPRQINRISIMRCSLIKVHDTYIGTDKIGHFVAMGFAYFNTYRVQVLAGVDHKQAVQQTVTMGEKGPIAEAGIVGIIPTGIYSNGDMNANYMGMKYFLNLMEPVKLKGQLCGPMVTVKGDLLVIEPHARPGRGHYAKFVSNHMDEVLNPSLFEWGMRESIRSNIADRGRSVLDWYAGNDPRKRNPAYFDRLMTEYSTYYGEDYGHSGQVEKLITVSNTCFDNRRGGRVSSIAGRRCQQPKGTTMAARCRSCQPKRTSEPSPDHLPGEHFAKSDTTSIKSAKAQVVRHHPSTQALTPSLRCRCGSPPSPDKQADISDDLSSFFGRVSATSEVQQPLASSDRPACIAKRTPGSVLLTVRKPGSPASPAAEAHHAHNAAQYDRMAKPTPSDNTSALKIRDSSSRIEQAAFSEQPGGSSP